MKTLCQPNQEGICTQCGRKVKPGAAINCPAKGRPAEPVARPAKQLGDMVQTFFESIGVTKDRYIAAKEALNLTPECGCDYRRELLNGVGAALGFDAAYQMYGKWRSRELKNDS